MTTSGLQQGETIKTPSKEQFSPRLPQSSQYVISLSPAIVSFPVLKIRDHVSFLSTTYMATANDWTRILGPKLFVKWLNHCNMLPCWSVFNVWWSGKCCHMLRQHSWLLLYQPLLAQKAQSRANCPLRMDSEAGLTQYFASSSSMPMLA